MTTEEIRRDIAAFADDEGSVLIDKSFIVFQRERQEYTCRLLESAPGQVDIEVNSRRMPYFRFLAEELGRLSILAESIRQKRKDVIPYIDTQAVLTDSTGAVSASGSALDILKRKCAERSLGETALVFLTAEAGEGKTALLRRLTQLSAAEYRAGHANSLLLHIDTQGRSFVRLEEAVARELGQLRISGLFYSGVVRLIRRGLLAIAIDGFDELLAEIGSSEAYSGLGAFLNQLGGSGIVVAAARTAYFQAENYAAQTRLLSSLPEVQVSVEQMRLEKWGRPQTVRFFSEYRNEDGIQIADPGALYDELASLVGDDHVILQRPFLVYTMARMLASMPGSAQEIVRDIGDSGLHVVPSVIKSFLKREVEEKWRDPSGKPYLTLDEHVHLLAAIADEMWTQRGKNLPVELVQLVTETVTEELNIPIPRRVQIVERIKAHVMLPVEAAARPDHRAFDHDEFFDYFLAIRLCELLTSPSSNNLRRFLEQNSLPVLTARWTAVIEPLSPSVIAKMVASLASISKAEVRSTYLKQNAGLIAARLASIAPDIQTLEFDAMYFEGDSWTGSRLSNAQFARCVFNGVDLSDCEWRNCRFRQCDFQSLTINERTRLDGSTFDETSRVIGLLKAQDAEASMRVFVPETCEDLLSQCGAHFERPASAQLKLDLHPVPAELRGALTRFLRIFARSSGATENVIKLKLGSQVHVFRTVVLPSLIEHGVIRRTDYRGSGAQERYELGFPVDVILAAENPSGTAPAQLKEFWDVLRRR
jgi:hypothetical protein